MTISEQIRAKAAEMPQTLWLDTKSRGIMAGRVTQAIKATADALGIPVSNARDIRLGLAGFIYQRSVATYNDLSHAELWAIDHWVVQRDAVGLLDWLNANFEHTIPLDGGVG